MLQHRGETVPKQRVVVDQKRRHHYSTPLTERVR
jgi:ribosomal protein S21